MSDQPCLNPNCKSHGQPHPNCQCYGGYAEGGEVGSACALKKVHQEGCQYFAGGGEVAPDFIPEREFTPDAPAGHPHVEAASSTAAPDFIPEHEFQSDEEKYGSGSQQVIAGLEGAAKGVLGPLATAAEVYSGITTPEAIRGREEANPITHGLGEVAGFAGSALASFGAAPAVGLAGKAAAKVVGTRLGEGILAQVATAGIRTGAEMAALQVGNEVSKLITKDPSQSLESAAINVGLAGVIGGAGGAVIGSVSPLWKAASKATHLEAIVNDAKVQYALRSSAGEAFQKAAGKASAGTKLGDWLYEKGAESLAGMGAQTAGAALGSMVGHPVLGALVGPRFFTPIMTSIAKPLLESATRSDALKASVDYVAAVIQGQKIFTKATENVFRAGGEVLSSDMIPDAKSRERLEKSLAYASNFDNAVNIGGDMGHYLPEHSAQAAALSSAATQYLNTLKPSQTKASPLDSASPVDPVKQQNYQRALGVAQQPLMVLQYLKSGTLQPVDVTTLKTIYPSLHAKMLSKAFDQMTDAMSKGYVVPYHQRASLSLLMGQPMDSTLTPPLMQAVMAANAPKGGAPHSGGAQRSVSSSTARTMEKMNQMYATPSQARSSQRVKQ